MTTDEAIAGLEAKKRVLEMELIQVKKAIWELELSACPIKVGDVVRYGRDGKEYKVIGIDKPDWGWVYANPKKADGTWGAAKRHLLGNVSVVTNGDR